MFHSYDGSWIDLARVVHYDGDELHLEGGHRLGYYRGRTDEQNQQNSIVEDKLRGMDGFISYDREVNRQFFNIEYVTGYEVEDLSGGSDPDLRLKILMVNGAELWIEDGDDVVSVLKALGHPE